MAAVDPSEFFCDSVEVFSAEWSDKSNSPGSRECAICGAPSNGFHFNAPSCSACAAFFRRTVTLDRNFVCNHQNNCRVNYTLRVICRACRYAKCIATGMERGAVQPRRDSNIGRRKLVFANHKFGSQQKVGTHISGLHKSEPGSFQKVVVANQSYPAKQMDVLAAAMDFSGMSPEIHYAQSFSSSEGIPSPKLSLSSLSLQDMDAEKLLDDLMKEERLVNERRKLLYCTRSSIYNLLSTATLNDIPFSKDDLVELTFVEIQKHIRPQILITYEWIRGWRHFNLFNTRDRLNFLRHCVLYHSIIDPAYLTFRLGLPGRFVMFNGMYVSTEDKNDEGWRDEGGFISAELKKSLYWPLMERVLKEVCAPMKSLNLTFVEFVILKSLVSFKSACCSDLPPELKTLMNLHLDVLFKALNIHYVSIGLSKEDIAERTGNIVLMMSSVFVVGMECLESHHKIQFFDLWQLDDLLLKLISPEPENSKPV